MDDTTPQASADATPTKRKSPLLILLLLILAGLLVVFAVDRPAKNKAQHAFDLLDQTIGLENKVGRQTLSHAQVHEKLQRGPDPDEDPNDHLETFSWQGFLRKYTVYVVYTRGQDGLLQDISLNEHPSEQDGSSQQDPPAVK